MEVPSSPGAVGVGATLGNYPLAREAAGHLTIQLV